MTINRIWGRCRAALCGATAKRWAAGLVITSLAVTGSTKSFAANERDVDFDWMFTSITELVGAVAPTLSLNLVDADIDGNGINEDDQMGALSAILRNNVSTYTRVTSINAADAAQIRADFTANRTVAGNDVQLNGIVCTIAQGLIVLPDPNCRLTTILRSVDVLGNVTGTFVGNIFLDLLAGYTTVGDNPATFNAVNTVIIEPIVQAALDALGQGGLYATVIGDFRIVAGNLYGHWGATPGGPPGYTRVNRFGAGGDLDGDTTLNSTEYTAAAGDREAFLRSNTIGVYSAQNSDQPIRITVNPVSNVYAAGSNINLTATYVGGSNASPYTYQWEDASDFGSDSDPSYGIAVIANGGSYSGANTQTLNISNLTFADHDGKAPWLRISDQVTIYNNVPVGNGTTLGSIEADGLGGRTSLFGLIKVVEVLPRGPIALCSGTQLLTASASALNDSNDVDTDADAPTYQWRFHATDPAQLQFASTNIALQTANTYTITAAAPAEGYYGCATTVWSGKPIGGALKTTVTNAVFFDFPVALPAAPSVPDLVIGSDSGTLGTDNITNDNTPTFTGTAEANALVTILDGVTNVGTATADLSGNWSITTSVLTDGVKSITATAANCVGTGPPSGALSVTIDTTAPALPNTLDLLTASDTGSSTSDDLTNVTTPTITGFAEAGSTVSLRSSVTGATVIGTSAAAPGFSIVTSALSSTPVSVAHSLTATTTDVAGNTSGASTALVVTVDTTAPAVPSTPDMTNATDLGTLNNDNVTRDATPDFLVTGDAGSTITLVSSVNGNVGTGGGPSVTITSTTLTSTAPSVTHNISAFATDPAGNPSGSSVALVAVIDTTVPAAPSVPDMTTGTDTGSSNSDNITNNQQPVFTGTAEAASVVTLFAPAAVGTGSGPNYSIAPSTPLAGGNYATVRARQVDLAGNQGALSTSVTPQVVIDITAPAAPTGLDLTTDTGVSATDDVTNDNTPTIVGVGETGATVTLTSNFDGAVGNVVAAASAFSITTSTLTNNVHGFTAVQVDPAGNSSLPSSNLNVTVDTVAPAVSSETPTRTASVATLANVVVNFSSPVFTPVAGSLTVNSSASTVISGSGAGPYTFSGYTNPPDGAVNVALLNAGITDLAGNPLAADAWTYTKTGSAPTVALTSGTVSDGGLTNASPVSFTATFSAGVSGFTGVGDVTVTGATLGAISGGPAVYTFTVTPTANGVVTVQVPAAAANAVAPPNAANLASLAYSFTSDTVAPTVAADSQTTNDSTPALTGTVNDNTATITVTVGAQINVPASNLGDGTWLLPNNVLSSLVDGVYNVQVTATDAASNVGTDATTNELTIDTVGPTVTVNNLATNDSTPALTGTVNDATALVRVTVGAQANLLATNNGNGTWTLANNTLTTLTDGTYDVSVDATDAATNVSSDATTNELVIDTVAPIITLVGAGSATVSCGDGFTDPGATANDTRDGDVSVNVAIAPPVGVQTPPGTYNVTYNVSDAVGNVATTVTRSVTVSDDCPLAADVTPTTVDKMVGEDHTFELTYLGDIGTVGFQWQKDDGAKTFQDIVGETNTDLALTDLQESDSGDYRCEVTDAVTTVYSPIIVLSVVNGVPAAGLAGLGLMAVGSALAGALVLRRKR